MSAHFTQLFALLYQEGKFEQLAKATEQAKTRMKEVGEESLWRYWRAISLAANGDFEGALDGIKLLDPEGESQARLAIASEQARQTNNFEPLITLLTERWVSSRSAADLMALCEIQLQAGRPEFVVEHAEKLVSTAATPAALRLALNAAMATKNLKLSIKLLDHNAHLFPQARLPADLRRLHISCSQGLGLLDDARRGAESLAREEESPENLSLLLNVHVQSGNLKRARFPAQRLVESQATSAEQLVEIARVMRLEDPELASVALRKAVERDLKGARPVGTAATVAFELNEESLIPTLMQRLAEEAANGSPHLHAANFEELVQHDRNLRENGRRAFGEWRAGRVPVHCLRRLLNVPLAGWPVFALSQSSTANAISQNPAVFFRYGGRPAVPIQRTIRRLYVDLTALHLAFELKILPAVEEAFGPLFLAPAARIALVAQADDANRHQPDVVAARDDVVRLLNNGKIAIWNVPLANTATSQSADSPGAEWWQAIQAMKLRNGLLLDSWPKLRHQGPPFMPPPEVVNYVTSMSRLLDSLEHLGAIERQVMEKSRSALKNHWAPDGFPEPEPGQTVLLNGNIAEVLAGLNLLEPASLAFRLMMSETDVQFIRAEAMRHQSWQQLCVHLRDLRNHITDNAAYCNLVLGDVKDDGPSEDDGKEEVLNDPAEVSIVQLIQAEPAEGYFVWIDDRLLNSHQSCGKVPIITTLGVIEELHRLKRIDTTQYFALRHRLRAADFRYVPLTAEEVAWHMLSAPVRNGRLVETPELATLRIYHSRLLLDRDTLQIPPLADSSRNPMGETNLLLSTIHGVCESIPKIFAHDVSAADKFARADWIFHQLWLAPTHLSVICGRAERLSEGAVQKRAVDEALFLHPAIALYSFKTEANRKQYFEWLESRFLITPQRIRAAAEEVRFLLEGKEKLWSTSDPKERKMYALVLRDWYLSLPQILRDHAQLSDRTCKRLFVGERRVTSLGSVQFDAHEFWRAAANAFTQESVSLTTFEDAIPYIVRLSRKEDGLALLFSQPDGSHKMGLNDSILGVLHPSAGERFAAMRQRPEWFDGEGRHTTQFIRRLSEIPDAAARVFAVDEARERSAWHYYLQLEQRCFARDVTLEQMQPPLVKALLAYLRLSRRPSRQIASRELERSAASLMKQVSLVEVFFRFAMLPVDLPRPIVTAVEALQANERSSLLDVIKNRVNSPMERLHYLRLVLVSSKEDKAANDLVTNLLSIDAIGEMEALIQAVTWTWELLGRQESHSAARRLLLSWLHGGILFRSLRKISDPPQIKDFLRRNRKQSPAESLAAADGEADVCCPRVLSPTVLMVTGVGRVLQLSGRNLHSLNEHLAEEVFQLCFMTSDHTHFPRVEWLNDPTFRPNTIGSFLGLARVDVARFIFDAEKAAELSGDRVFKELEAVISSLESLLTQEPQWVLLFALLGNQPCPPALRQRLARIIESVSIDEFPLNHNMRFSALVTIATHVWNTPEPKISHVQKQIARLARFFSTVPHAEPSRPSRENVILLATEALSKHAPPDQAAHVFAETLVACVDEWPDLANAMPGALEQMLLLPDRQLEGTWPLILRLRFHVRRRSSTGKHEQGKTESDEES